MFGGDEEDRTPDLRIANATLSQLSYVPTKSLRFTSLPAVSYNCRTLNGGDEELVSISLYGDSAIPKRLRFGTANKLGLVGVLREVPRFAGRTPDLRIANATLSQLQLRPRKCGVFRFNTKQRYYTEIEFP